MMKTNNTIDPSKIATPKPIMPDRIGVGSDLIGGVGVGVTDTPGVLL